VHSFYIRCSENNIQLWVITCATSLGSSGTKCSFKFVFSQQELKIESKYLQYIIFYDYISLLQNTAIYFKIT